MTYNKADYDERSELKGVVRFTTAPKAYDYGYTTEVSPGNGWTVRGKAVRTVMMPAEDEAYQIGRYWSGGYVAGDGAHLINYVDVPK